MLLDKNELNLKKSLKKKKKGMVNELTVQQT